MATPARTATGSKPPPSYFVDQKKGEVNELKALLRNKAVERDPRRKREIVKKVIAYMTLGFDVSRLFGEMVMASSTSDMILKKMCYLYLDNYARANEELATLVKNVDLVGFYWGGYLAFDPAPLRASLARIAEWAAAGQIAPHIGLRLPLERAGEGLQALRERRVTGKVVVELSAE